MEASGARPFVVAAFVVAAFGLVMAGRDEQAEPPHRAAIAPVTSAETRTQAHAAPEKIAGTADASSAAAWDSDFVAWVRRKYQYLFVDAGEQGGRLLPLLLEWENAASVVEVHGRDTDPALRRIEAELRALLSAAHLATFHLLKNSDEEQHHLLEFTGGISNVSPLTGPQQRAVLEIKLHHKQTYDAALRQSGLYRDALSVAEREYAHRAVAAALRAWRNDYLQEVRPLLDEEQYILLSNYDSTEIERELQRLQMLINAK